uniref:Putative CNGA1-overlapping antisense gene protein n=1 Tax=Homo sapiens TaxID=9606 RepID=CNG1O_HUMAN|nr:PUTATIVE PSEUDOGENE: RecName: Full=Putative CNGA1-overlapping antisense gene protein; AltName: Full=Anti-CNG1 [Homo sapiens]AAN65378.1 putative anti-CNG alpha 1 cation channel translation product [Homo sapiens]
MDSYSAKIRANLVCRRSTDPSIRVTFSSRSLGSLPAFAMFRSSRPSFIKICFPFSSSIVLASGYSVRASMRSSFERQNRSE